MVDKGKSLSNGDKISPNLTVKEVFGDMEETGRPKITVTTQEMLEDNENYLTEVLEKAAEIYEQSKTASKRGRNENEE